MRLLKTIGASQGVLALAILAVAGSFLWPSDSKDDPLRPPAPSRFLASLPPDFEPPPATDRVAWRIFAEYGAVFVARGDAIPPPVVIFPDEATVMKWQLGVRREGVEINGIVVELQKPALAALLAAREEARSKGQFISPRGADSARRSYEDTVRLWRSRVHPGLDHWVQKRRMTREEAARIRALTLREQVGEILGLEDRGFFFSTDRKKSILISVAPPGTSQHLSMLAFDVKEHENASVRRILAAHGWFQTISTDLPHFTFLGVSETELPELGLKPLRVAGRTSWVPDLPAD